MKRGLLFSLTSALFWQLPCRAEAALLPAQAAADLTDAPATADTVFIATALLAVSVTAAIIITKKQK